jgi:hypothetical protein
MTKEVEKFFVENPEWTFGKKLVVLATDYDALMREKELVERQLQAARKKNEDLERAARQARTRESVRVVK